MTVEEMILKGIREECRERYPGKTITNCFFDQFIFTKTRWSFYVEDFAISLNGGQVLVRNADGCGYGSGSTITSWRGIRSFEIADPEFPENMLQFLDQYLSESIWTI